jgi:Family of unknown function (DUF5342)
MLQHFQIQPLYNNDQIPGWMITFFYKREKFKAYYLQNGQIEWIQGIPLKDEEKQIKEMIHELMLFHVYDR